MLSGYADVIYPLLPCNVRRFESVSRDAIDMNGYFINSLVASYVVSSVVSIDKGECIVYICYR